MPIAINVYYGHTGHRCQLSGYTTSLNKSPPVKTALSTQETEQLNNRTFNHV